MDYSLLRSVFIVLILKVLWVSFMSSVRSLVDKYMSYPQEKLSTVFDLFYLCAYTEVIKVCFIKVVMSKKLVLCLRN